MKLKIRLTQINRYWILITFLTSLVPSLFASGSAASEKDLGFRNIYAKEGEGSLHIYWSIDCDFSGNVSYVAVRYKKHLGSGNEWVYSELLRSDLTEYKLDGLAGDTKYDWQIGYTKQNGEVKIPGSEELFTWSPVQKNTTNRPWGLYRFIVLIGALGMFIYGMKVMSEGLQQSAGGRLRQILGTMTSNRYVGVLSGFLITALVQSSSATTVMTVSFVNAGLLTLTESAGIMMGANIGTTITGWLISVFGFKVSISAYSLFILAIGAPFLFIQKGNSKSWGSAIIGFALLFMGLGFLKDSVPDLDEDSPIIQFFAKYSDIPFLGRVLFVGLGALVTIIIQSSSAAMALTLALVVKGIVPFEVGAAMILGENIGTTITAELASLVGNVHAKRSARIHSMFNIVGVSWMIFLMPFFLQIVDYFVPGDPFNNGESAAIALAGFHSLFNLTNVLIMIWMVPFLIRLAVRTVPSKGEEDEIFRLEYISAGMSPTPELSIVEAQKEVVKLAELDQRMLLKIRELLNEKDRTKHPELTEKLRHYEHITDRIYSEISKYLLELNRFDLTPSTSTQLRAILSITNDLEHIGDMFIQMMQIVERKMEDDVWFSQKQREYLNGYLDLLGQAFNVMLNNLKMPYDQVNSAEAIAVEQGLDKTRDRMRKKHLKHLEKGDYPANSGLVYSNLISHIERIGDLVLSVTEGITGQNIE
ncbi:MAG: Na/Pi cotransporter family protein [Flavobacteriales bacterium]|nr:Na/Pi cotransporter family protein [Flavobacteriales bacterium]